MRRRQKDYRGRSEGLRGVTEERRKDEKRREREVDDGTDR